MLFRSKNKSNYTTKTIIPLNKSFDESQININGEYTYNKDYNNYIKSNKLKFYLEANNNMEYKANNFFSIKGKTKGYNISNIMKNEFDKKDNGYINIKVPSVHVKTLICNTKNFEGNKSTIRKTNGIILRNSRNPSFFLNYTKLSNKNSSDRKNNNSYESKSIEHFGFIPKAIILPKIKIELKNKFNRNDLSLNSEIHSNAFISRSIIVKRPSPIIINDVNGMLVIKMKERRHATSDTQNLPNTQKRELKIKIGKQSFSQYVNELNKKTKIGRASCRERVYVLV